jgi:hypothetical protein
MSYQRPGTKRKPHPADIHTANEIARATSWAVAFRKSPYEKYNATAPTLAEARAIEAEWNAAHGEHGRRAIVYAVTPENRAYPLPA